MFPLFGDEYAILPDQWPASSFLLSHGPPTTRPAMERENPLHSSAAPAQSPDEEGPSLSATPSQATGCYYQQVPLYSLEYLIVGVVAGKSGCFARQWAHGGLPLSLSGG